MSGSQEAPSSLIQRSNTQGDYRGTIIERLYRAKLNLTDMLEQRGYEIPYEELKMFVEEAPSATEEEGYMTSYVGALRKFGAYYYSLSNQLGISFHQALGQIYTETDRSVRFLNSVQDYTDEIERRRTQGSETETSHLLVEPTLQKFGVFFPEPVKVGGEFKVANTEAVRLISELMSNQNIFLGIAVAIKGFVYQAVAIARQVVPGLSLYKYDELNKSIIRHSLQPLFFHLTNRESRQELSSSGIKLSQLPRMSEEDPVARFYGAGVGDVFRISRQKPVGREISYRIVMPTPLAPKTGVAIKNSSQIFSKDS